MITWIDEESKKEHMGPSAWKRASKSTIRRILVERAAQWANRKKGTAKPLYRAVAHVAFRNFLCNAACLHCVHNLLSPHKATLGNTDQFIIVIIDAGVQVLFFDRSEAAVFAAASTSCQHWRKGRASLCCSDWDAAQALLVAWLLAWLSLVAAVS
jgi:hypothetical protein